MENMDSYGGQPEGVYMTVDYNSLSAENRLEYGRSIGRIGKPLLEDYRHRNRWCKPHRDF